MKVSFYCGYYRWDLGGGLFTEPPECCTEGVVDVDDDEWAEKCVTVECPACGATLEQVMDNLEPVQEAA